MPNPRVIRLMNQSRAFKEMAKGVQCQYGNGDYEGAAVNFRNGVAKTNKFPSDFLRSHILHSLVQLLAKELKGRATSADMKLLKAIANGKYNDAPHVSRPRGMFVLTQVPHRLVH